MAIGGFGPPEVGKRAKGSDPAAGGGDRRWDSSPAGRLHSPAPVWRLPSSPRRISLLERSVLRSAGLIKDEPAGEARSRSGESSEPGVPADRAGDRANAGSSGGAGEGALLGRAHFVTSGG